MNEFLHVSSNPHDRDPMSTDKIMKMVAIALAPACLFGIYNFGPRALMILTISVASCVFFEWLYEKLMHKPVTIGDFSAVVTGLLLGMNMPPMAPRFWLAT